VCTGSNPVTCTALDQCHDPGTCDSQTGCSNPAKPDDTPCDDGNACTGDDKCTGGSCFGVSPTCGNGTLESTCGEQCDDGNNDNNDGCSSTCQTEPPCPAQPRLDCRQTILPKAGLVSMKKAVTSGTNKITWKWKGQITPKSDFGQPDLTTAYHFCIYDESAGTPNLVTSITVPPSGTCGVLPCWKGSSTGFLYKDKTQQAQGVTQVKLKQGLVDGKAQAMVKGKGVLLPVPTLPFTQDPAVIFQLSNTAGVCWTTKFNAPATKNLINTFGDKTD